MRVVFYSSCSNYFDPKIVHIKTMPSWAQEWGRVAAAFPRHKFVIATMLPAMFLLDYDKDGVLRPDDGIERVALKGGGAKEIAQEILDLRPDVAVAASFWITPYDWLGLQDAMVADILRGQGVKVVSHSAAAQAICFDKKSASDFLRANGFSCAKSVYVDYELFWAERKKSEVCHNVYREYVFRQIERLSFPVIIKDTVGLSSYGMEVVHTAGAVKNYLESKKFNSNRLVEEFLDGPQFGTEVHVTKRADGAASVDVFPPLFYSVNQYGICSPKQSVKLGPLTMPRFKCDELKSELERLARLLDFEGIAQVDLVFHKDKWHIIEINPRLSGSSAAIALINGKTLPRILTDFALAAAGLEGQEDGESVPPKEDLWKKRPPLYLNIKFPNLTPEQMEALYALPYVHYLCQTDNDAAKQRREMGFCEILIGGSPKPDDLLLQLKEIEEKFPKIIEPAFFDTAKKMLAFLLKNS
ncbi:MAG: ATP-grasp domain-containing protein [Treponema sp.]|nr:ATP-grasp domain-containing protein [Treponema sp.]